MPTYAGLMQRMHWNDLVRLGVVEYIDVREEETTMVAMYGDRA